MTINQSAYVQCECGHELSAFRILKGMGRMEPSRPPDVQLIQSMLSRLRCSDCSARGKARLVWKTSAAVTERFVATVRSGRQVFHRETCGWIGNIKAGDEVVFSSAKAALRRGYQPCSFCRPG